MKGVLLHPLRVGWRLFLLGGELLRAAIACVISLQLRSKSPEGQSRARWLQAGCRRVLRILNVEVLVGNPVPDRGLLVCNHLGYLDVLVLGALAPSVFVAKREVGNWPVFGWFARRGGTLFADREHRTQAGPLARTLGAALDQGALVVLFPEGTSSGGQTVLPFKSALLEPVTTSSHPLSAGQIEYRLEDGDAGEEVCYWKDMTLLPHLLNLLSKRRIQASVRFAELRSRSASRKELARQLHAEVCRLKEFPSPGKLAFTPR